MQYDLEALKKAVSFAFNKNRPAVYQRADVIDGYLVPLEWAALKYLEIREAAKFLEKDFTFVDYGCGNGLFSFLLAQGFPGVSGKLINSDAQEIETCQKLIKLLDTPKLEAICLDMMKYDEPADLTIYMSLVRHLLKAGESPTDVADRVARQTGVVAVVEGQMEVGDWLTGRNHEEEIKVQLFLDALAERMKVISWTRLEYIKGTARICYIFQKKR